VGESSSTLLKYFFYYYFFENDSSRNKNNGSGRWKTMDERNIATESTEHRDLHAQLLDGVIEQHCI
jgi:hypothetical protein